MGTVLLDSKGVGKVMNTSVDALVIVTDVLTSEDTKLLERIYMSKKNLVMILLTGTRDIEILTEAMSCGIGKVLTTDMEQSQIQEEIISEIAKTEVVAQMPENRNMTQKFYRFLVQKVGQEKLQFRLIWL